MSAGAGKSEPIIIVKKHAHHAGHHGGAWKVAYADFVTAMMALFIVLWLLSSSQKVQKAVGGYFQDPKGKGKQTGTTEASIGETLTLHKENLNQLKDKLEQLMRQMPDFTIIKDQVKMTVTAEGLRIDLLETSRGMFFETGNPKPTDAGEGLLKMLAGELIKLPNKVAIEGHTDSNPYGRTDYSNWELSADRANSARRIMQDAGLRSDQVSQVRGFADQRLLMKSEPTNPKNRRISIIVRNLQIDAQEEQAMRSVSPENKPAEQNKPAPQENKPAATAAAHASH
jgi:chemotaxis protein MotB